MKFSDFLSNLCCSQAMTDFWGPKTSYANAGHSYGHIPMWAHWKHLSSLTGCSNCHTFPPSQSVFLRKVTFCVAGCPKIEIHQIHMYVLELSSRMRLFYRSISMFLVEMVTYTYWKIQFLATCTCVPYLFWFWQHKSCCLIKMQIHEYLGSEWITRR